MRNKAAFALCLLALILPARRAAAVEDVPGGPCTGPGLTVNSWMMAGAHENGGVVNGMFCESNTWHGVINFQSSGYVGIGTTNPGALLDVGKAGTLGTLRLEGSTSGYVQLQTNVAAGSWTMTLPTATGTVGQVLSTDGAGVTSWISNAGTASTALSGITAAAANHTIANANFAQVWNWDTLTTGTAMTLGSISMTTGSLLALSNTNTANAPGNVLHVSNSEDSNGAQAIYAYENGATTTTYAVEGDVSSSGGNAAGVYGYASGGGRGVVGYSSAASGVTDGVVGQSNSTTSGSSGVFGYAEAASGLTIGVTGQSDSTTGGASGVYGHVTAASGSTNGVAGQSDSTTDGTTGVYGYTTGATGVTDGVAGEVASTTDGATGVYGSAAGATGATNGVEGANASTTGEAAGVWGEETAASGATYGVYGSSASATGFGGYFTNTNGGYALVTGSGKVGIGTTTPGAPLDVTQAVGANVTIANFEDSTFGAYGQFNSNAGYGSLILGGGGGTASLVNTTGGWQWNTQLNIMNGNVGIGTTAPASKFVVAPNASETIAAAAIITADGCGTLKEVTSTAARSTNTTNTFTNSTSAGCCMKVYNTGAFTITLKHSANFKTVGAADLSLTSGSVVGVCSDGAKWFQSASLISPS